MVSARIFVFAILGDDVAKRKSRRTPLERTHMNMNPMNRLTNKIKKTLWELRKKYI